MDFPSNVPTNTYTIHDVYQVHWAFYSRQKEGRANNDRRDENDVDERASVEVLENELRERGHHVLSEGVAPDVWIFCLSQAEAEKLTELHVLDGYECQNSGCIRSSDLSSGPSPTTSTPTGANAPFRPVGSIGDINRQTFSMNTKVDPWYPATSLEETEKPLANVAEDYTTKSIYPRIVAAIILTLSYYLLRDKGRLLVGSCVYVDEHTLGDHAYDFIEAGPAAARTVIISCWVRWLGSGTLLFTLSESTTPRLYTLSHLLFNNEASDAIPSGTAILLSPSGTIGEYYGIEDTPNSHPLYHTMSKLKSIIVSRLKLRGIAMPEDLQWVLLRTDKVHSGSLGVVASDCPILMPWPAHLCLSHYVQSTAKDLETPALPDLTVENAIDPLGRAQDWFLGKAARLEALEARRLKDLTEARKRKEAAEMDDEDSVSEYEPPIERNVTPRDPSGIYPTPPDGLPSIVRDSSVSNEVFSDGLDDGMNGGNASDQMDQSYKEQRDDDLFEEMDIDLFATNGLTEDDFNFFDEPSPRDGASMIEDAAAAPFNHSRSLGEPSSPPASTLRLEEYANSGLTPTPDDITQHCFLGEEVSCESREELSGLENHDQEGPTSNTIIPNTTQESNQEPTRQNPKATNGTVPNVEALLPDSSQPQEASFDLVQFNDYSHNFDSKYNSLGRYNFQPPDDLNDSKPETNASRRDTVPYLGIIDMEMSSPEIDIDSDETSDEPPEGYLGGCTYDEDPEGDKDEAEVLMPESIHRREVRRTKSISPEALQNIDTPMSYDSQVENRIKKEERYFSEPPNELYSPSLMRQGIYELGSEAEKDVTAFAVVSGTDQNFIHVAQIVAHQAVSGLENLEISRSLASIREDSDRRGLRQEFAEELETISSKWGKASKRCTLSDTVNLDEHDSIATQRDQDHFLQKPSKPLHPTRAPPALGQVVPKLQEPCACVQRTGVPIDLAASALQFWEGLSLAPSQGHKNITAFCVSTLENVQDQISVFLDMMKGAYQSCNLGLHDIGTSDKHSSCFNIPVGGKSLEESSSSFCMASAGIGKQLGKLGFRGGNTVIYMVDPSHNGGNLAILCKGFLRLFDGYLLTTKQNNVEDPNDLVLQIIPSKLIYSTDSLPMPSPSDYKMLAFEVYDRCGPNDDNKHWKASKYNCAPAIRLAKAIPKTIDFRLTSENSALSLQSDNCLHIACDWNLGENWLTASWTDNLGVVSWTACYCLGGPDENPWSALAEVVHEIMETTLNISQPRNGPWHLFVSKPARYLRKELEVWQSVFQDGNSLSIRPSFRLSFLTIDLNPLLDFPIQETELKGLDVAAGFYATPESTPQAMVSSPDITVMGTTPGGVTQVSTPPSHTGFGDQDGEARLIAIVDETWGVVTRISVDDPYMMSDYCPALACGYLVKRAGPRDEDGLVRMGVNVVHGQTPHRPLLKAVLGWYRNLGFLARARGIADPVKSVMPCHIAATLKAHAAVVATMRYGDNSG